MVETNYRWKGATLPVAKRRDIDKYVRFGTNCGDFLMACLSNDLMVAVLSADEWERELLPVIMSYIHYRIPGDCYGSYETVGNWKGLEN